MDKQKILIVSCGEPSLSGGFMDRFVKALVNDGFAGMDVEVKQLPQGQIGLNSKLLVWDEITNVDFATLEAKAAALQLGEKVHNTLEGVVTGRLSRESPEFQELPGVDKLHAEAWDQLLQVTGSGRQLEKELTFLDRYSSYGRWGIPVMDNIPRKPIKSPLFATPYGREAIKPADHPTRKREPKGPRGHWGKLK